MNENNDLLPNLLHEEFEMQMRGYSRRQVDDFVARRNNEIRELEQRLARALDESEHLRREIAVVRQQALSGRPAHEEVSERIAQILKLADDEAKAQKNKAEDDIAKLRAEALQEADRVRGDSREQAERMLTAAQEQAERTITVARSEADKTRTAARTEADRLTSDTRTKAEAALANAKAQAKKVLDEATARASAIHDGAERRLNLLSTRHADTVRRLTDILDGVQGLVAAEAARMSLEEEVNQTVSRAISQTEGADLAEGGDLDLARLAPPAPETVALGTAAPTSPPRDVLAGRPAPAPQRMAPPAPQPLVPPASPAPPAPTQPVRSVSPQHARHGSGAHAAQAGRPDSTPDGPGTADGSAAGTGRMAQGARPGSGPGAAPLPGGPSAPAAPGGPGSPVSPGRSGTLGGSKQEDAQRGPIPMPSGSPRPGPVAPGSPSPGLGERRPTDRDGKRDPADTGPIDPDEPTEGPRLIP